MKSLKVFLVFVVMLLLSWTTSHAQTEHSSMKFQYYSSGVFSDNSEYIISMPEIEDIFKGSDVSHFNKKIKDGNEDRIMWCIEATDKGLDILFSVIMYPNQVGAYDSGIHYEMQIKYKDKTSSYKYHYLFYKDNVGDVKFQQFAYYMFLEYLFLDVESIIDFDGEYTVKEVVSLFDNFNIEKTIFPTYNGKKETEEILATSKDGVIMSWATGNNNNVFFKRRNNVLLYKNMNAIQMITMIGLFYPMINK